MPKFDALYYSHLNRTPMTNEEFVDFLFGKLVKHVDMEEIDLSDDDSICTALDFEQLGLF